MTRDMDEGRPPKGTTFCLDCEYVLSGLDSYACPECGRAFDPKSPATFKRILHNGVQIARLPIGAAGMLGARLESHGIETALNEERGGVIAYAELPCASVWVDRDDEQRAREIMKSAPVDDPGEAWTCPECGERIEGQFAMCWSCGAARTSK